MANNYILYTAWVMIFFMLNLMYFISTGVKNKRWNIKKSVIISGRIILLVGVIYAGFTLIYDKNILSIKTMVIRRNVRAQNTYQRKIADTDNTNFSEIKKMVMRETSQDFVKQGFVAIPSVGILLPVFNDAYSRRGLDLGANYANKSSEDPNGSHIPVMGKGNYGLAAHNFNDGQTGFSPLQEYVNKNYPYINERKLGEDNWLNGEKIYLANDQGIYTYKIVKQTVVGKEDISVLNNTSKPRVTIISCLFPNTNYRIITSGKLVKYGSWSSEKKRIVQLFNLKNNNTNARANWYNSGMEEGSNGSKGI